jgi:hypothetical protein
MPRLLTWPMASGICLTAGSSSSPTGLPGAPRSHLQLLERAQREAKRHQDERDDEAK